MTVWRMAYDCMAYDVWLYGVWRMTYGVWLYGFVSGIDSEAGSFANIESNPYTSTEGAVYSITHEELSLVDGHHGYPEHYSRLIVPVWVCNATDPDSYHIAQYCVPAVTYIARDPWTCPLSDLPASSKEYSLRQVINGAEQLSTGFKDHLSCMLQECCA